MTKVKLILSVLALSSILLSCKDRNKKETIKTPINLLEKKQIHSGKYVVFSYKITQKFKEKSLSTKNLLALNFYFTDDFRVKIAPVKNSILPFKDSIYKYELKSDTLLLTSRNQKLNFRCNFMRDDILDLYVNSSYINRLTLKLIE